MPGCHTFIEHRISRKYLLLANLIILFAAVFVIVITLSLLETNAHLAILFSFGSLLLSFIACYKYRYRRRGYETIALDNLPKHLWIIRVPGRRIGLIYSAILAAAILAYTCLFCFDLARQ